MNRYLQSYPIDAGDMREIQLEGMSNLKINANGMVLNFQNIVKEVHGTLDSAWGLQWDSMQSLKASWASELLHLQDVMHFILTVENARKVQSKRAWKGTSLALLHRLSVAIIESLASMLDFIIVNNVTLFTGLQVPSRAFKRWVVVGCWLNMSDFN